MSILHVTLAVFIVGPMAILPMTGMRAIRAGSGGAVAGLARSTLVFSLLSLLVVIFGFGLLGMADPKWGLSFTTPWILISTILYVIALVLSLAVVVPALRGAAAGLKVGRATGSNAEPAASAAALPSSTYPRIAIGSGISALLLVAVVVLMVWKP
ncbi:MAG: DUF2269 family protein [Microbacteriaceae bacterium]